MKFVIQWLLNLFSKILPHLLGLVGAGGVAAATGGVKPAVEFGAAAVVFVILLLIGIILLVVGLIVVVFGEPLKDYGVGGAAGSQLTLVKTVDVLDGAGNPTGTNRIATLDGQAHRVSYRITMSNGSSSDDAENISLYDNQCGQTFTPPTLPRNHSAQVGTCEIEVIADLDRVVINEVIGTATMDGSQVSLHT